MADGLCSPLGNRKHLFRHFNIARIIPVGVLMDHVETTRRRRDQTEKGKGTNP